MRRLGPAAIAAAGVAALAIKPKVRLADDEVELSKPPADVLRWLSTRLLESPDVIAGDDHAVVRRFRGRAGPFPYRTVEVVEVHADRVTFDHLSGPFAYCHERLQLEATPDGSRLVHSGSFRLRGGLWTWPLAIGPVRTAFENHVHLHLHAMAADLAA